MAGPRKCSPELLVAKKFHFGKSEDTSSSVRHGSYISMVDRREANRSTISRWFWLYKISYADEIYWNEGCEIISLRIP